VIYPVTGGAAGGRSASGQKGRPGADIRHFRFESSKGIWYISAPGMRPDWLVPGGLLPGQRGKGANLRTVRQTVR